MKLLDMVKRYKWILVGAILFLFLLVSVIFGVHFYQYRASPEYTFTKLQTAIQSQNISQLATLIDFRKISSHIAEETAKSFPFFMHGPHQIQKISNVFQGAMLKYLKIKNPANDDAKITDPEELLKKPIYILPEDIIVQLGANLQLRNGDKNSQIILTSFEHPILKQHFPLVLRMLKTNDGWIISDLVNAQELVSSFRKILEDRLKTIRTRQVEKAKAIIKEMHEAMDIQSCTAQAGLISDHKTVLLVVHLMARNKTGLTVKNVNAATRISNARNVVVLERNLNSVEPTPPGGDFSYRWIIELDSASEEGHRLLTTGPLSCAVTWRTMTMSSARVYHAETPPSDLERCPIHKDPHPEGLCKMEIFTQK